MLLVFTTCATIMHPFSLLLWMIVLVCVQCWFGVDAVQEKGFLIALKRCLAKHLGRVACFPSSILWGGVLLPLLLGHLCKSAMRIVPKAFECLQWCGRHSCVLCVFELFLLPLFAFVFGD